MELLDAYDLTMSKVNALRQSGIQLALTPPKAINDEKLIAEVEAEGGLPVDKWMKISFQNLSADQKKAVYDAGNYLCRMGIIFDCGGAKDLRDWEIDWSFKFDKSASAEWLKKREELEFTLDNVSLENLN